MKQATGAAPTNDTRPLAAFSGEAERAADLEATMLLKLHLGRFLDKTQDTAELRALRETALRLIGDAQVDIERMEA